MIYIFPVLSGLIHFYIFLMESILWGKPRINKVFAMTPEQAENNRLFAYNQGFYNLFLSMAVFTGVVLLLNGYEAVGKTLMVYSCLSMLGASLILISSSPNLKRPAFIQGLPPLVGLILFVL